MPEKWSIFPGFVIRRDEGENKNAVCDYSFLNFILIFSG